LASQISPIKSNLFKIITLGLRKFNAKQRQEYSGLSDLLEFLADLPCPEKILAIVF
jgi:hypothetical protein